MTSFSKLVAQPPSGGAKAAWMASGDIPTAAFLACVCEGESSLHQGIACAQPFFLPRAKVPLDLVPSPNLLTSRLQPMDQVSPLFCPSALWFDPMLPCGSLVCWH